MRAPAAPPAALAAAPLGGIPDFRYTQGMADRCGRRGFRFLPAGHAAGRAALLLASVLTAVVGCSSSTAPPPAATVVFTPAEGSLSLTFGTPRLFSVSDGQGQPLTAVFRRAGTVVATASSFNYPSDKVGADSLRADVQTEQGSVGKIWRLWVEGGNGDRPPPVLDLVVTLGPQPGTLRVTWNRPAPSLSPRPFLRYWVKIRYGAPLNADNWDGATLLEEVPSLEGALGYQRDYSGLQKGVEAWVGVRLEDTGGVLSPLPVTRHVRVAGGFRVRGVLLTLDPGVPGREMPLAGMSVSVGDLPERRTLSGPDGSFVLPDTTVAPDGFRDVDRFVLSVRDEVTAGVGGYYDFRSDSVSARTVFPMRVMMIPARDAGGAPLVSSACWSTYTDPASGQPEFLNVLEDLTATTIYGGQLMRKWDHYPVKVWVRPGVLSNSGAYRLDVVAKAAVRAWNEALAEADSTFTVVGDGDSALADVDVVFSSAMPPPKVGTTEVIDPPGGYINQDVPRRILVTIHPALVDVAHARAVSLHELGHALCLGSHSLCPIAIMNPGTQVIDPSVPLSSAVAPEEALAVRYVRHLAQNLNMRQYLVQ